jgi:hypothetical protein
MDQVEQHLLAQEKARVMALQQQRVPAKLLAALRSEAPHIAALLQGGAAPAAPTPAVRAPAAAPAPVVDPLAPVAVPTPAPRELTDAELLAQAVAAMEAVSRSA